MVLTPTCTLAPDLTNPGAILALTIIQINVFIPCVIK